MPPPRVEATTVDCVVTPLPRHAWLATTVLLLLLSMLALSLLSDAAWIDPRRLAPIEDYALDNKDSTVFALARARAPDRAQADFLLLGSSATREATWDEATLAKAGMGRVAKLTSSGQTPLESLFLLEQQPLRRGQVVILSIGVTQLASQDQGLRLASGVFLQNPQDFADAHGGLMATEQSWLQRRLQIALGARSLLVRYLHVALPRQVAARMYDAKPLKPLQFYYDHLTREQAKVLTIDRPTLRVRLDDHAATNLSRMSAALEAAARSCARQGATLVLLENPHLDSDLYTTFGNWWAPYQATVRQVAQRHHLRLANLGEHVPFEPDQFIDAVHLTRSGRAAWSAQLLQAAPSWRAAEH